jgi:hypothetical protein
VGKWFLLLSNEFKLDLWRKLASQPRKSIPRVTCKREDNPELLPAIHVLVSFDEGFVIPGKEQTNAISGE